MGGISLDIGQIFQVITYKQMIIKLVCHKIISEKYYSGKPVKIVL